jgi:aspartate/methionine/tyrosine aminotransferase
LRDYVTLSPGKLNDALAVVAMRHRQAIFARNRRIISQNLATAEAWVAEHADLVSWKPPRAGLLALLHYRLDIPSLDLANKLAEEYSVMLAPGSAFGFEQYLRIGIGQAPAILGAGLAAAAACLAELRAAGVGLVEDSE